MAKLVNAASSQLSKLTVGLSPGRGMRLNLPIAIVPLASVSSPLLFFQHTAQMSGDEEDEQMASDILDLMLRDARPSARLEGILKEGTCKKLLVASDHGNAAVVAELLSESCSLIGPRATTSNTSSTS